MLTFCSSLSPSFSFGKTKKKKAMYLVSIVALCRDFRLWSYAFQLRNFTNRWTDFVECHNYLPLSLCYYLRFRFARHMVPIRNYTYLTVMIGSVDLIQSHYMVPSDFRLEKPRQPHTHTVCVLSKYVIESWLQLGQCISIGFVIIFVASLKRCNISWSS